MYVHFVQYIDTFTKAKVALKSTACHGRGHTHPASDRMSGAAAGVGAGADAFGAGVVFGNAQSALSSFDDIRLGAGC